MPFLALGEKEPIPTRSTTLVISTPPCQQAHSRCDFNHTIARLRADDGLPIETVSYRPANTNAAPDPSGPLCSIFPQVGCMSVGAGASSTA